MDIPGLSSICVHGIREIKLAKSSHVVPVPDRMQAAKLPIAKKFRWIIERKFSHLRIISLTL
jgi:hypothetical protein